MILLDTTITFSVAIMPVLYLLAVITGILVLCVINFLLYKYYDKATRYNPDKVGNITHRIHNLFLLGGMFMFLLFKKVIRDARRHIDTEYKLVSLQQSIMMVGMGDVDYYIEKIKNCQRSLKLLKLKYKRSNFVKRIIFHIFVKY